LTIGKTGFAAAVMGLVMALALPLLSSTIGTEGLLAEMVLVLVMGGIGGGLFVILAVALNIEEWRWISTLIKSKMPRRSTP